MQLLDENTQKLLPGDDTQCAVTIIEDNVPGTILGFQDRLVKVRRGDDKVTLFIERKHGNYGQLSFYVKTLTDKSNAVLQESGAIAKSGNDF